VIEESLKTCEIAFDAYEEIKHNMGQAISLKLINDINNIKRKELLGNKE